MVPKVNKLTTMSGSKTAPIAMLRRGSGDPRWLALRQRLVKGHSQAGNYWSPTKAAGRAGVFDDGKDIRWPDQPKHKLQMGDEGGILLGTAQGGLI